MNRSLWVTAAFAVATMLVAPARADRTVQSTVGPITLRPFDDAFSAGFAAEERHDYPAAAAHYDQAVASAVNDQDFYFAYTHRAPMRSFIDQHAGARADIDAADALPAARQNPWAHALLRLQITRAQGDLIAASAAFRQLKAAAPNPPDRDTRIALFLEEARLRRSWGDLSGALDAFDEVEPVLPEAQDIATLADYQRDRALCHLGLNDLAEATTLARDALSTDLRRAGTSRRRPPADWIRLGDVGVAQSLLVSAETDRRAGRLKPAQDSFERALELAQRLGAPRETVRAHFGLTRLFLAQNDLLRARLQLVAALLLTQRGAIPDLHIETTALIGECCLREEDPAGAIESLTVGITEIEQLRLTAPAEDRQRLLALQADQYRWLLEAYLRTNHLWEALATSEGLKARTLRDAIGNDSTAETLESRIERLRTLQRRLPTDLAVVSYANVDWSRSSPIAFVLTATDLRAVRLPTEMLPGLVKLLPLEDVLAAQDADVDATRYDRSGEVTLAGLVAYYREQIYCDANEMQARIPALFVTAKLLRHLLITPLDPLLADHSRLLISPSGLLAYVPFDTLRDLEGKTLLNDFAISLTPSLLTTLDLAERPAAAYRHPFLGFGGAVYDPSQYSADMADAPGIKQQLQAITAVRGAQLAGHRSPYAGWARGPANNLAGTKAEVELLGELLPGSTTVVGRNVAEGHLRAMAARGELRDSRVIHFAVHGSAMPIMPELSCILLSWEGEITPAMPAERDGRLQITEFASLNLRAELVTFSACQTGLGAIVAGEGVVGLTGSLLQAGADNVLASLWPVSDYSTVYFMRRYYELHLLAGVPSDLAIAQVKRDMEVGQLPGYQHPQFWAPFNLYGGRELVAAP